MKKIFTLMIGLMATLSSWAQGFVFQYHGENLEDGAEVIIAAEEDVFGEWSCMTNDELNPSDGLMLKLIWNTSASVRATLEVKHNSFDGAELQWCMGTGCQILRTSLTKQFTMGTSEAVHFDAVGINGEGFLTATLKVSIGLESHQVNIMFVNGDYDGIHSPKSSREGKGVVYHDLLGRRVQGRTSSGMYIVNDGEHLRKVIIK